MQFGLMLRAQFTREENPVARFEEVCAQARLADALGFASITKGSHFGADQLFEFQQIPFLARIAAEAPRCRLNAGVVLLSLHKPLDIAEQLATLDVISGGRAIFGCALGYREVEFKAFGTTQRERVPRFEENLVAIKRLWTEDRVTMTGSHFELDDVTLGIRPVQQPRPPIWVGANSDPAVRRAARMGDCWYIPPHNRVDTILRQLEVYRRELDVCGRPFPEELPIRREVFVAPTREEAFRLCAPSLERKYRAYHHWGQDKPMPAGDNDLAQSLAGLERDRFVIGAPDEVTETLAGILRATGANHLIISLHWPGMSFAVANDAMRLFAAEVMPRLREAA
jgi:alkanesulfonate monooxygenase SsuD/methylene tetrahydromethanopterin reductase-like flavin-dependent oxidoreductase (luciferase family)